MDGAHEAHNSLRLNVKADPAFEALRGAGVWRPGPPRRTESLVSQGLVTPQLARSDIPVAALK
jgi:hypothetical protein